MNYDPRKAVLEHDIRRVGYDGPADRDVADIVALAKRLSTRDRIDILEQLAINLGNRRHD